MPSLPFSPRQFQNLCVSISTQLTGGDWSAFHLPQAGTELPVLPFQHSPSSHQQELGFQAVQDHSPAVQAGPDGTTMPRTTNRHEVVRAQSKVSLSCWVGAISDSQNKLSPKKSAEMLLERAPGQLWAQGDPQGVPVPQEQGGTRVCKTGASAHKTLSSCSGVSLLDCDGAAWQHWGSALGWRSLGMAPLPLWFRLTQQPLILHFFNSLIL